MCCRYYYDQKKVDKILKELRVSRPYSGSRKGGIGAFAAPSIGAGTVATSGCEADTYAAPECGPGGTINPGSESLLIAAEHDEPVTAIATWGFPGKNGQLIINARSESALQKPMFCNSLENRRCVLPAECFYEWDAEKNKFTFTRRDVSLMYLAGIWRMYDDVMRFVVLTTAANASMMPVHDRMPLIIDQRDVAAWLLDTAFAVACLKSEMPMLSAQREYEQMSFL